MKIKTLSKLLAAPLCVLLIVLLCTAPAVADTNANVIGVTSASHESIYFIDWMSSTSMPTDAGNYRLTKDVSIYYTWNVPEGENNLDLNGHSITFVGSYGSVISVSGPDTTLNLYDKVGTGKITGGNADYGGGVYVYDGSLTMYGGNITSNRANDGGGVCVNDDSNFAMYGGTITGNTASYGGGVCVYDYSTITMSGGTITGNTAGYGGGVYLITESTFEMYDGTISGNTILGNFGGGVDVTGDSTFAMYGGTISDNTANSYSVRCTGGVYVSESTFTLVGGTISSNTDFGVSMYNSGTITMYGGNITGNTNGGVNVYGGGIFSMSGGKIANNAGNGVYVNAGSFTMYEGTISDNNGGVDMSWDSTFTMYGGTITGNMANHGGGVSVGDGTFSMYDGNISGNTATYGLGGGVDVGYDSTFAMYGGSITGNMANEYGGGVYMWGDSSFSMSGGNISGNTVNWDGGGVYVEEGTFTMSGGTISGNRADSEYRSGGGVYVSDGIFSMSGGIISGNSAGWAAGGVYVSWDGTFTMSGGTITGNTAKEGRGVYNCGMFTISGSANIAADNNVYIVREKTIFISGDEFIGSVANITVPDIYLGYELINITGDILPESICDKFILTNTDLALGSNGANGLVVVIKGSIYSPDTSVIQLIRDVTLSDTLVISNTIGLDLNGYTLRLAYNSLGSVISVKGENTVFSLYDNSTAKYGRITGGSASSGGGVSVNRKGTFNMYGGTIYGNKAEYSGSGVFVDINSIFTMYDGTISYNSESTDYSSGGGVYVGGTFTMYGGTISSNTARDGGGVDVSWDSTFTMYGGTISGNTATYGGGVYVCYDGNFSMCDGNITCNKANGDYNSYGGGVYVCWDGSFTMSGGSITSNKVNGYNSYGGGVYVSKSMSGYPSDDGIFIPSDGGKFVIVDGSISGNTADRYGGGVYVDESSTTIYDDVEYILPAGEFIVCGGTITGNFEGDSIPSNVYLRPNAIISTLPESEIADGTRIGVTAKPSSADESVIAITDVNTRDYSSYFFADKSTDRIENRNNVLYLISTPSTHWAVQINLGNNMTAQDTSKLSQQVLKGKSITQIILMADTNYCFEKSNYPDAGGLVYTVSADKKTLTITGTPAENIFKTLAPASESPHSITISTNGNGTATASPTSAKYGTTVTLTATPNTGYAFSEWQVISGNIQMEDNVFTMPFGDVSIKAIFLPEYLVPVEDTTESVNAATAAEVGYRVTPINIQEINAPSITRGGRSIVLDEKVVVKVTKNGVEIEVPASVNPDGTVNVADADIAGADSVSVTFVGRKIGDVSGDGSPNTLDAAMILKASAEIEALDVKGDFYGDVTNDGQTTTLDAARILQHSADMTDDDYELIE